MRFYLETTFGRKNKINKKYESTKLDFKSVKSKRLGKNSVSCNRFYNRFTTVKTNVTNGRKYARKPNLSLILGVKIAMLPFMKIMIHFWFIY